MYYSIFDKKKKLVGVAGIHPCEAVFNVCLYGLQGRKSSFRQLFPTHDEALSWLVEAFGGERKIDIYEVDFHEYESYKRALRRA